MMKKILVVLMLLVAAAAYATEEEKWITGAVKALITKSEMDTFKKLKTDAERDEFIAKFWEKLDPSSGTPENEFKDQYDKRVQQINDLKIPSKKHQGADTDMGQALILLGQPTEQKQEAKKRPAYAGGEEEEAQYTEEKKMIWIYRELPPEIASGEVTFSFDIDPNIGEWKFSDKKLAQEILDKAREHQLKVAQQGGQAPQPVQRKPPVQPAAPLEGKPVATPALKAALDAIAAGNPPKDIAFESMVDSFMTSKGELFATVAVNAAADMSAAQVGIRVVDSSGATVKELEFPYASAEESAGYFQTPILLPSGGDYTILLAVSSGEKAGGTKQTVKVANATDFAISSIILAKKFDQLTEAKLEGEPYTFGKVKVHPSLDHVFVKADEMTLVYEVYNFGLDPTTNKPNLEATLTFSMGKNHPSQTYPITGERHLVMGKRILVPQAFPLQDFPVGTWTVNITVKDKVTNASASRETQFTLK